MTDAPQPPDYPGRADLIGGMLPVLKAARRPLPREFERSGLDREGWRDLHRLVGRLIRHHHFEHLERKEIRSSLQDAVLRYRETPPRERPDVRVFVAVALDSMAREPMRRTVYLGVRHLALPHGTRVADVTFIDPTQDRDLLEAFERFKTDVPALLCAVEVEAGTRDLLLERARARAGVAFGLLRQQNLFGFSAKIYLDQVSFALDGTWTWQDGDSTARAGWWRSEATPIPMDLTHDNAGPWRDRLGELSDLYEQLSPPLRERVDVCLEWLDVAALSEHWRIIIPAIFSGMEALLVPETIGLKAEVVTVRSAAVHVACGKGFFDPGEVLQAYDLRSALIHGTPTTDVIDKEASDFADRRRRWAFRVLADYLVLARDIGAESARDIVRALDADACTKICGWLEERGAEQVVAEYRKVARSDPSDVG